MKTLSVRTSTEQVRARREAFTLIELLVVIAIIAVLASLLLPALQTAQGTGKSALCASHLKQLGVGFFLYTDEWEGCFPPRNYTDGIGSLPPFWWTHINPHVGEAAVPIGFSYPTYGGVFVCPEWRNYAAINENGPYGVNPYTCPRWPDGGALIRLRQVRNPSTKVQVFDCNWFYTYEFSANWQQYVAGRHRNGVNIVYSDGHVDRKLKNPGLFSPDNPWHWDRN